jgi:hypothetical protein
LKKSRRINPISDSTGSGSDERIGNLLFGKLGQAIINSPSLSLKLETELLEFLATKFLL